MWQKKSLKDLCSIFADGDWIEKKDQSVDGIRLVQTGNIKMGYFAERQDKARYISEDTFNRLNCTEVKRGDILVSRLPDPVGRASIIPELKDKAITAVDCTIIRLKEEILPTYLNHYMQSPQYLSSIQLKVTGATRQRISRKNLGEIPIIFPSLAEQERIVAKLDAAFAEIDEAVSLAQYKIADIQSLKNALLASNLSNTKTTEKLGDVIEVARGGSPRPIKSFITTEDDGVNWIKIGDTKQGGKYISTTKEKIKPSGVSHSRYVKENDFLLSNSMSFGRPYILKTTGCIHDGWLVLSKYQESFIADYLYYLLSSSLVQNQFESLARGSTVRNLNIEFVSQVMVPILPLTEQQRVVAKLDVAYSALEMANDAMEKSKRNYQALKSAILSQELQPSEVA